MALPFSPVETICKWQQGPLHMENSGLFVHQYTVIGQEVKGVGKDLDHLPDLGRPFEHGKSVEGDTLQASEEALSHCQSLHIGHLAKLMF